MDNHGGFQQFSTELRPLVHVHQHPFFLEANLWDDCIKVHGCSGVIGNGGYGAKISEISDGTSNTFCIGEILPECRSDTNFYGSDMWSYAMSCSNSFCNAPSN